MSHFGDHSSLDQQAHDLFDQLDKQQVDENDDPISLSVSDIVATLAERSRALAGNEATANALIENLCDLHGLIEDQAGPALSDTMLEHVTSILAKQSMSGDRQITVTLPGPEVSHPTARLLSWDALENALILNGQSEENEALVAYTSAALSAISDSLHGTPSTEAMVARIRTTPSGKLEDSPRAVTVH